MGAFDNVTIRRPLPWLDLQDAVWQSKDTPAQCWDDYEVREDGTLWHLAYDMRTEESEDSPLGIWLHRDNERWEQVRCEGQIEVCEYIEHGDRPGGCFYSVTFWFRDGIVADTIFRKIDR